MSEVVKVNAVSLEAVDYGVPEAKIAEIKEQTADLDASCADGYKGIKNGLSVLTKYRTSVEKKRMELKRPALEYGRAVDAEAKRITALILDVEDPLRAKKKVVDDMQKKIEEEAKRKEEARVNALEAKIQGIRALASNITPNHTSEYIQEQIDGLNGLEITPDADSFAEFAASAELERKYTLEALAGSLDQRKRFETEQAIVRENQKKLEEEKAKLAEERKKLEAHQRKLEEAAEKERQEAEAKRLAEAKAAAEAKAKAEAEKAEKERLELAAKLAPDMEKVKVWVGNVYEAVHDMPDFTDGGVSEQIADLANCVVDLMSRSPITEEAVDSLLNGGGQ